MTLAVTPVTVLPIGRFFNHDDIMMIRAAAARGGAAGVGAHRDVAIMILLSISSSPSLQLPDCRRLAITAALAVTVTPPGPGRLGL
jgi:hypothetical protein